MAEEFTGVAEAVAPAPETPTDPTAQAPTAPAQPGQSQYVPYERFQQVNTKMREFERIATGLQQQIQQMQRERQAAGQPQPSQEEIAAREALYRLDPNLKSLPEFSQKLQGLEGQLNQFVTAQQSAWASSGQSLITEFVKGKELPDGAAQWVEQAITGAIRANPELHQRVLQGDMANVVRETLDQLDSVLFKNAQRQAAVNLATAKTNLSKLPPRPTGGAVGPSIPTLPKDATAEQVRDFQRGAHADMRRMLREQTG